MEEFSFNALTALLWANKLITGFVISTLLAALLIQVYWEKVGYFLMRVWHGVPLIGTVARKARGNLKLDAFGWPSVETEMCEAYHSRYKSVDQDVDTFNKSEAYLHTIGERGRSERPFWVFALIFILIMFEAVGFAYVLVPFINQNLSANDQSWMGWLFAFLLAVASAILAEVAGRAVHRNTLVNKARHWWENDSEKAGRPNLLKQLPGIGIKHTHTDKDGKDYNRILARLVTNHTVTPAHGWLITTGIWIVFIAVAAFGIRTMQLKSIETEMVGSPHAFAQQSYETNSPFDLPSDSAALNGEADKQTLTDKMDAIRKASLITFIVLSVIYIAIQITSIWLASIFGFAGVESKTAWKNTHKFSSDQALEHWMSQQRMLIAGHANYALNKLQPKLAARPTTNAEIQAALASGHNRNFERFLACKAAAPSTTLDSHGNPISKPSVNTPESTVAPAANEAPSAPAPAPAPIPAPAPAPAPAPIPAPTPTPTPAPASTLSEAAAPVSIDGLRSKDLTAYSDEQLATISTMKGYALSDLRKLRDDQQLLKDFDATGA